MADYKPHITMTGRVVSDGPPAPNSTFPNSVVNAPLTTSIVDPIMFATPRVMTTTKPPPRYQNIQVRVIYDSSTSTHLIQYSWEEPGATPNSGNGRFGLTHAMLMTSIGGKPDPVYMMARMLDAEMIEKKVPHDVGEAIWHAWQSSLCQTDPLGLDPDADQDEHIEPEVFPETAQPILARLEAEVELCEDELQKSRLSAILASLQRIAPAPADEVADDVSSGS